MSPAQLSPETEDTISKAVNYFEDIINNHDRQVEIQPSIENKIIKNIIDEITEEK